MKGKLRNKPLSGLLMPVVLCLMLGNVASAWAGVAVIVNPNNSDALDKDSIAKLFLGKEKSFPGGEKATPLMLSKDNSVRGDFITKVLGKNESQYKVFWSRQTFSGKGVPPQEIDSEEAIKISVANDSGAIGFISADKVDASVKVVAEF